MKIAATIFFACLSMPHLAKAKSEDFIAELKAGGSKSSGKGSIVRMLKDGRVVYLKDASATKEVLLVTLSENSLRKYLKMVDKIEGKNFVRMDSGVTECPADIQDSVYTVKQTTGRELQIGKIQKCQSYHLDDAMGASFMVMQSLNWFGTLNNL